MFCLICNILAWVCYSTEKRIEKWYYKWLQNDWKTSKNEPVKNKELWEKLIVIFEQPNFHHPLHSQLFDQRVRPEPAAAREHGYQQRSYRGPDIGL